MNNFFDKFGLIHLHENPKANESENPLLFTAEWVIATQLDIWKDGYKGSETFNKLAGLQFKIQSILDTFIQKPFKATGISTSDHFSHDNMTGLYCLAYLIYSITGNDRYINTLPILSWNGRIWWHPRDILFYCAVKLKTKGKLCDLLSYPLLIMPLIAMMVSCWQSHKTRGGNKIIKTDGKMLSWLRTSSLGLTGSKSMMLSLIRKSGNFTTWKEVSAYYFKDPLHPVTENINE